MRKIIFAILATLTMLGMSGCGNMQLVDTTYTFNKAIIALPNGDIIKGKIDSWKDYEGDQLQIKIDGVTYLAHSSDVVMIKE